MPAEPPAPGAAPTEVPGVSSPDVGRLTAGVAARPGRLTGGGVGLLLVLLGGQEDAPSSRASELFLGAGFSIFGFSAAGGAAGAGTGAGAG